MLRASVEKKTGSLILPVDGSTFDIVYFSKLSQGKEKASITVGPEPNIFYAQFKENDVDFEIEVNNNNCCPDRALSYGVDILSETEGFRLGVKEYGNDITPSQLHFLYHPSETGQLSGSTGVTAQSLSNFSNGPIRVCQIKFEPRFSQIIRDLWIEVKTPNEDCLKFQLRTSDSIKSVKKLVREKTGVDPDLQELILHGKFIDDDDQYLKDCCDGKTNNNNGVLKFHLIYKSFSIFVKIPPRGKRIPFEVFPMDTVKKLKERIERKTGIGADEQKLVYARTTILSDKLPLLLFQKRRDVTIRLIVEDESSINGGLIIEEEEEDVPPIEDEPKTFCHNFVTQTTDHQPSKFYPSRLTHDKQFKFCGDPIDERGAIGFGGKLSHTFTPPTFFDVDESIVIEPFVIEMRLAE